VRQVSARSVLFLASDVPWPPDGGGRIASLHVFNAFTRQFDVDLLALADPFREIALDHLRDRCRRFAVVSHPFTFSSHPLRQTAVAMRSLVSTEPYRLRKFRSQRLTEILAQWKSELSYDLVHHEQLGVAQYHDPRLPATALVQNVESQMYRLGRRSSSLIARTWAAIEGAKLARREPALLKRFDEVFVLSRDDREALARLGVEPTTVVPMPAPDVLPPRDPPSGRAILSLGSMSWFGVADGLRWFHDLVLPAIQARVPDVTWNLVGPGAPRQVRTFEREPNVLLHGYVETLTPILEQTRVAVVPLRIGGGIRMKLLDLMAWGVPSVATTIGGQGLGFSDGDGCFRRDEPAAFADAVVRLLLDDRLWRETTARGREYIARSHPPGALADAIGAGVERAFHRHARRGAR
jgi:glycosyltransferase involved in cell wall biosynthesis